jgi:hypothetical protein
MEGRQFKGGGVVSLHPMYGFGCGAFGRSCPRYLFVMRAPGNKTVWISLPVNQTVELLGSEDLRITKSPVNQ